MRTTTPSLDRFFQVLLEEIRDGKPAYEKDSFTVAEIYQSLIPYRTHRDRLGVEMNGDYEDAILRLLGGEGDFLVLESDTARERIRLELRSPNPNTGLYREYAAVGVHLNPDRIDAVAPREEGTPAGGQSPEASPELELEGLDTDEFTPPDPAPEATTAGADRGRKGASGEGGKDSAAPAAPVRGPRVEAALLADPADPPASCPDCATELPARDNLRFCPFCGTNVFVMPCGECGEVLERNWQYCIACGAEAA